MFIRKSTRNKRKSGRLFASGLVGLGNLRFWHGKDLPAGTFEGGITFLLIRFIEIGKYFMGISIFFILLQSEMENRGFVADL